MQSGRTTIESKPPTTRAALTNGSTRLRGIDGRSAQARRRRDLIAIFSANLNPDDVQRAAIVRAAELVALAEDARRRLLAGGTVDLLALVRLENLAGRAVRDLGLRDTPEHIPLRQRLAQEQEAAIGEAA